MNLLLVTEVRGEPDDRGCDVQTSVCTVETLLAYFNRKRTLFEGGTDFDTTPLSLVTFDIISVRRWTELKHTDSTRCIC